MMLTIRVPVSCNFVPTAVTESMNIKHANTTAVDAFKFSFARTDEYINENVYRYSCC
jgi:hypothetical protein